VQFEQAAIKVQKEKEFQELKAAIDLAFAPEHIQKFLRLLASRGLRVRDFNPLLEKGILERVERSLGVKGAAQILYSQLTVSDQAQVKEYYLFKVEEVGPELRSKFHKLYQYY
jgi:hypothetical protein